LKIEISQYTTINDIQKAVEEFDGTLTDYLELQLKHIRESGHLSVLQQSMGESGFTLVLSDNTNHHFKKIICKAKIIS